jgi:hypothetical protein
MLNKSRLVMLVTTVALVASAMFCSLAFGQSKPASTAAATSNTGFVLPANDGKWHTVLSTTIKNPTADDDLFIDVSQVDRITTTNATSSATPSVISGRRQTGDASSGGWHHGQAGCDCVRRAALDPDVEPASVSIANLHPDANDRNVHHVRVQLNKRLARRYRLRSGAGACADRLHSDLHNTNRP